MKSHCYFLLCFTLMLSGCSSKNSNENIGEPVNTGETELLEKEVMKVHDEAMARMGEVYKWKNKLKDQLQTQGLSEEKKQELNQTISRLDSAYDGMMVWMRKYHPVSDSVSQERAREYLENEMEKVRKVQQNINTAIEKAEAVSK